MMVTRWLRLTRAALLCCLVCASVGCAAPVMAAAASSFGSPGPEAGQLNGARGIGIDQQTGDLYVGESDNERVSKFESSGTFLLAWGWDVNETSPVEELQTCTTSTRCQLGSAGTGAGQFASTCGPQGVAVDNSNSAKDVYVEDFCNHRVQKFGPSGEFLLMFGGHVNETKDNTSGTTEAERDVCVSGEKCTAGTEGTNNAEFTWAYERSTIAIGPGGAVYVGDTGRIQVFDPSGLWRENISLAGISLTGQVTALAVTSTGAMFVKDEGVAGVRELEPNGTEISTQLDAGSESVEALTLDASGDLFVADASGGLHILEYGPAGDELESFGSKTAERTNGIVFSDSSGQLYVSSTANDVWILPAPVSGPLIEAGSESAVPGQRGTATLQATVNPEGYETTYRFEYVDQEHFQKSGYMDASSTPDASIGSGASERFEELPASAQVTGLVPGETYHYRIVATNSQGTSTGSDQTVTTISAALVEGPSASDVAATSATLSASIDPLGADTTYRLEYGVSPSYGQTLSGNVGNGEAYIPVSYHRQGLQPGTTYHYRLVTTNEVGTIEGSDHTFTTQPASAGEIVLPDGRSWELVSPPNKKGALIEPFEQLGYDQAASGGNGIAYVTEGPHVGEDPAGRAIASHVLSRRGPSGWNSEDITLPRHLLEGNGNEVNGSQPEYFLFSPDLSTAAVEPPLGLSPPLSPEATERTLYLRNDNDGVFSPLVTAADVLPGTKFGGEVGPKSVANTLMMKFLAATPDLAHVVFQSPYALTPGASSSLCEDEECGLANLYEWATGQVLQVNILPDGKPALGASLAGQNGEIGEVRGSVARAVSSDGRWVAWTSNAAYQSSNASALYVRDMLNDKTTRIGWRHARYQTMTSDGSTIFFLENGDLYAFDTEAGTQIDLTSSRGTGESSSGVQELVSDTSEDGTYVYFVATGALAKGAIGGQDNLYLLHREGASWSTTYITTLSSEDEKSWNAKGFGNPPYLAEVTSRVSPDGRYLAFMSNRALTGYDNTDARGGRPDEEVYLYDAPADRLVCASCDPTGARPVGVLDPPSEHESLLVDRKKTWASPNPHWLAGSLPGWDEVGAEMALYQPRYLSDSGRLFFNSPDALVPQDTNGREDVYEYEPAGVGGTDGCSISSLSFSERSAGCVNLISSGTSSGESVFADASETGDDVFFYTASRLTAADYDTSYDVYDAHVCSESAPCVSEPAVPPPCSSGDSCKAAPSPQPAIFGQAPSATFSGAGNVVEEAKTVVKHKAKAKRKPKRRMKPKKRNLRRKKSHIKSNLKGGK